MAPAAPWWQNAPPPSQWDRVRDHWRLLAVALLVLASAGGIVARVVIPTTADRYLAELKAQNLSSSYANDDSAVAEGKAFCTSLTSGKPNQGYRYQLVAVRHFCPKFTGSFTVTPTPAEQQVQLMKDLIAKHLDKAYTSPESAVSQSQALCSGLDAGKDTEGYASQLVGVQIYCPKYAAGFTVIPTPQEQQDDLTGKLRDADLGGTFASDAAAVAHAQSVCKALDDGGDQQGPKADAISISVYCAKYSSGFTTLKPIKVRATQTVIDSDSYYSPGLVASGGNCSGTGGYDDIYAGQDVIITNADGKQLARTVLGAGVGDTYKCNFPFTFTVMEGESDYIIEISHRGQLHYTQAQLKIPGEIAPVLGS